MVKTMILIISDADAFTLDNDDDFIIIITRMLTHPWLDLLPNTPSTTVVVVYL